MARKAKAKASPQSGKAKKGRKAGPSADAAWPGRALGRRQVLKGVVAGSGVVASAMSLPKEWTKPVVQSIVASAHAEMSPVPLFNPVVTPVPIGAPIPSPLFVPIPLGPLFVPTAPQGPPTNPFFVPIPIGPF